MNVLTCIIVDLIVWDIDDKHELEELNKNNQHVLRTDMTSTVIQLFTRNSKHIQMNFSISYKTFKGIAKEHSINCNIDF